MSARNTIFIVDDDSSVRKSVERLLRVHGLRPEVFDSGENFFRQADPRAARCLVLDIQLTGMSGIEVARQLALCGISLPIIFITANDTDAMRRAAIAAGCVAYLTKPFSPTSLIDVIEGL